VGGGGSEDSSVSKTVIGGGEGEWTACGEGAGVGNGGGGGLGRVAPKKSLDDRPAAMISRSNSSPTKMCPGRAVSSEGFHCPSKEASPARMCQYRVKSSTSPGYAPSKYLRTPSVENRTASPCAEWIVESGEGRNPE
jgi:hypothetical protein